MFLRTRVQASVCAMFVIGRVKETEGESSVFYYKVDRQMKEVGEIVLSVRIRPWLYVLVCVCLCVCEQRGSPWPHD